MILAIDSGNTFVKLGVYLKNESQAFFQTTYEDLNKNLKLISENYTIKNIVTSVVGKLDTNILKSFFLNVEIVAINHHLKFPFHNLYETPQTLGIDRMVLSAGAVFNFPNKNRLVIDMGSCITYDFINANDDYLGGAISPGLNMRYEALNEKTAKLPLLAPEICEDVIGKSTKYAIHSGVMNGVLFEINGYITHFLSENDNFIIILTGGSSFFFCQTIKKSHICRAKFFIKQFGSTLYLSTKQ